MRRFLPIPLVVAALVAIPSTGADSRAVVVSEYDGDTVTLGDGHRVRLLQIDTPELGSGECYSRAARSALVRLVPLDSAVTLEVDPSLDTVDRYGRLLRYVWHGSMNVNIELVREGAAAPYFYDAKRGRYAGRLLTAAHAAKAARRGLWGACPHTVLDPFGPVQTGQNAAPARNRGASRKCDASYPTVCIPPPPPDLDCADIPYRHFKVRPPDPHGFDGNHDGVGCEL